MNTLNERDIASTVSYRYHAATKHTVEKLHGGGWGLDWANQPDPFRRYIGTETVPLPPPERPPEAGYFERHPIEPLPWNLQRLSQFLYYSVAISAWKEIESQGARWSLRVNPSAGNLQPTETHVAVCGVEGLPDGLYHFRVDTFALECRAKGDVRPLLRRLRELADVPPGPVTVLLSSIVWRQAWKYRDRAFRYCLHDLGHALACVSESLQGLGYRPEYRLLFDDGPVAEAFGLCDTDEFPAALVAASTEDTVDLGFVEASDGSLAFHGSPNALSESAFEYRTIAQIHTATASAVPSVPDPGGTEPLRSGETIPLSGAEQKDVDLWTLVRQRRSAVGFDGRTRINAARWARSCDELPRVIPVTGALFVTV